MYNAKKSLFCKRRGNESVFLKFHQIKISNTVPGIIDSIVVWFLKIVSKTKDFWLPVCLAMCACHRQNSSYFPKSLLAYAAHVMRRLRWEPQLLRILSCEIQKARFCQLIFDFEQKLKAEYSVGVISILAWWRFIMWACRGVEFRIVFSAVELSRDK